MRIYLLEEDYHEPQNGITYICRMTFLAVNDVIAKEACMLHPFRLSKFILYDAEGSVIYDNDPTKLNYDERRSPWEGDGKTTILGISEALNSFSSVPIELRPHFDNVIVAMTQYDEERYRDAIEKIFSPVLYHENSTGWDNNLHPVKRRRMYSKHTAQVWQGVSS
jgi:hypothetical protein